MFYKGLLVNSLCFLAFSIHADEIQKKNADIKPLESIEVIGKKHNIDYFKFNNSEYLFIDEIENQTKAISTLLSNMSGVDLNGQGGLLQVVSVRGLSGSRVQSQFSGIKINSERRAGAATSFIDSFFIDNIEVIKGIGASYYGSGAIGGVVQMTPKQFNEFQLNSSYVYQNKHLVNKLAWGNDDISLGLSHQKANNSTSSSGSLLNDHFEQLSANVIFNFDLTNNINGHFMMMPSLSRNIGKANSDDYNNKKITTYPKDDHYISQIALYSQGWQFNLAVHKHALNTQVVKFNKRENNVSTGSTDYSFNYQRDFEIGELATSMGLDYQYRSGVKSLEKISNLKNDSSFFNVNLDAKQYDTAIYANVNHKINDLILSLGARGNLIKQDTINNISHKDTHITNFTSLAYELNNNYMISFAVNRAFRFPTLSERFYTGTTGRGQTIGNQNLKSEKAFNKELSINYQLKQDNFKLALFENKIENYIERVHLSPNFRTYQNVKTAKLKGMEFSFYKALYNNFSYQMSGHFLQGKDDYGNALADIAPNKLQMLLNYQDTNYRLNITLKHRFNKSRIAKGEQNLKSINTVNAKYIYDLDDNISFSVWVDNLFNEDYFVTSDIKSVTSTERQIGLGLNWRN